MMSHLLRCQGLAVKYYGFVLGRLGSGASLVFATTGFTLMPCLHLDLVDGGKDIWRKPIQSCKSGHDLVLIPVKAFSSFPATCPPPVKTHPHRQRPSRPILHRIKFI